MIARQYPADEAFRADAGPLPATVAADRPNRQRSSLPFVALFACFAVVALLIGRDGETVVTTTQGIAAPDFGPVETLIAWEARTETPTPSATATATRGPTRTPAPSDLDRYGACQADTKPGAVCVQLAEPEVAQPLPTCTVGAPVVWEVTCVMPGTRGQSSGEDQVE